MLNRFDNQQSPADCIQSTIRGQREAARREAARPVFRNVLYDQFYCLRGEAENRIKETQLDLFGTCASCHKFHANWLRLMFAALAYILIHRLRDTALAGTELAKATAATIRVRLLKIGAVILRNTRRVRIMLASHHPLREAFLTAARALAP